MAKPSLSASKSGQQLAEQALKLSKMTKKGLSESIGCSRQPVTNFFKGVAIEQPLFVALCDRLDLDWQTIAGLIDITIPLSTPEIISPPEPSPIEIEPLVQQLRQTATDSIKERCGTMRVLDMTQPVDLGNIYTNVNILEKISRHQRRSLSELAESVTAEDFDRISFGKIAQARKPAIEAVAEYKKLIVLGKPGAGKTTFLKYLAIQCIENNFESTRLPLFVNLKHFSEQPDRIGLLDFISQRHLKSQLTSLNPTEVKNQQTLLKQVLQAGRGLLLLDGLDEVTQTHHDRVLREIRILSEGFAQNHFLMTCRVAAWEYTFETFTEVEIADFEPSQIKTFSNQWFHQKPQSGQSFLSSLNNKPTLKELATTPLLLTLLCSAFEASGSLPHSRSELYREGVEILLKKWDASRGIHRDQVYQRLSVKRKEDLLGQIALTTFEQGQYFFKQLRAEQLITDYIQNLPEASENPAVLQLDSAAILYSIEAQHGLLVERFKQYYSFSHLTFHEYFVARELVLNSPNLKEKMREIVADYALDPQWREVFLLASELLRDADLLLAPLLARAEQTLANDSALQTFLQEINNKASQPCFEGIKPAVVRAFWFDIDFEIDDERQVAFALGRSASLLVIASFLTRSLEAIDLAGAIALIKDYDRRNPKQQISQTSTANEAMLTAVKIAIDSKQIDPDTRNQLKAIYESSPLATGETSDDSKTEAVADAGRTLARNRLHIGQDKQFNAAQKRLLKDYYQITHLLVDCLSGAILSKSRRQSIEQALFCPTSLPAD